LTTTPIFENTGGDVDDGAAKKASTDEKSQDCVLLDFLYPEKTLALLKRSPVKRLNTPETRRRQPYAIGVRHFSTIRAQPPHHEAQLDGDVVEQAKKEAAKLLRDSDAYVELQKFLRSPRPGEQELAWQLYTAIPEDRLAGQRRMRCDLLKYLVQDGEPAVPERVLQVFGELRPAARRLSSYRAAIKAYIALGMVGPAIQLLDELAHPTNHHKSLNIMRSGIDVILRRLVLDEQWDLAFRVFRTFRRQTHAIRGMATYKAICYGDTLPEIWGEVAGLPELPEHFQSFLRYVGESQPELKSSQPLERDLACFVMTFVPHVMDRVLNTKELDEDFVWDYFIRLFDDLHALQLPTSACYEYAIKQLLNLPRYQQYNNQRKIPLELYRRYRQLYLDQTEPTSEARPSANLIRNLIYQHSTQGGLGRVQEHLQDLRAWYPNQPLQPGLLKHLIRTYADAGHAERVHEYVDELRSSYKDEATIEVLSSLLYVYARRADVAGTITQFKRIHEEFRMTPDTACWNILLLAYVRAEDLDGALECFNNCLDYGVIPDVNTFGPLLDFCAHRGDVEAFETLFSKAKQMGIQLDMDVRARAGYVEAFMNAGDEEGAEAIAQGMLSSWKAGRLHGEPLTHTWNLLIQQRALDRDLAGSREQYKQMVQNNIPLNSWTYGSLMRALVEVKQTNAAYKLLRVTMPEQGFRVHALHYAIVMTGFLREGQYAHAVKAYERMKERKVPQTESSRQASIQVLGLADRRKLEKRGAKHPNYKLLRVEEALEEMLASSTAREVAHRQPAHERSTDVHNPGALPQSYYGLMISLYSARSAYKTCKKLFQKAEALAPDSANYTTPLTLTTSIMEAHLKAGDHAEVAKCWELAHASAANLTKTFHQAVHQPAAVSDNPETSDPTEHESLIDPLVQQRFQESRISNNRRNILTKPARIYIRSLLAQSEDPNALQQAQRTIRDLLVNGFMIDTLTWNEFIQQLVLHDRLIDAFTICEAYLMPRFPGWRELIPNYIRNDRKGFQWMELRHNEIKKSSVLPRYKTMVLLAKAYGQVKSDERNGIGYDADAEAWMAEILERSAPLTVRALDTMPRTFDHLQERYFNGVL
jgi:pentatricopeptide repeat-containing protein PET309